MPPAGGFFGEANGLGDIAAALGQETRQRLRLRLLGRPPVALEPFGVDVELLGAIGVPEPGVQVAEHRRGLRRLRVARAVVRRVANAPCEIALGDLDARQTGERVRMVREGERGALELAPRVAEPAVLQQQMPELREVPRLPFGVVRAGAVGRHPHAVERRRRDRRASPAHTRRARRPAARAAAAPCDRTPQTRRS